MGYLSVWVTFYTNEGVKIFYWWVPILCLKCDFTCSCPNSTLLSALRQTKICCCVDVLPHFVSMLAAALLPGETRKLQMLCQCLLHASAMKPRHESEAKKNSCHFVPDFIDWRLGDLISLTETAGLFFFFFISKAYVTVLWLSVFVLHLLSALHTPLGKLSSGCYELLTSVHMSTKYPCLAVTECWQAGCPMFLW